MIEVLRQAKNAFVWNLNTDLDNIPACDQWAKMLRKNIDDLDKAIAELESQEPVAHKDWCASLTQLLLTHPPKPALCNCTPPAPQRTEQEPVAWLEPEWGEKICPEVGYEVTMTDDHPRDLCWIPLYAHPPQRTELAPEGANSKQYLERLIRIMGTFDLATGHADTFDELLDSLESELRDVLGYYRQQRTWVGLTNEEIDALADLHGTVNWAVMSYAPFTRAIEAKLKEKNT